MPNESTPEFRYFLDYDEETDSLNIFAAVTNYGLYGEDATYRQGDPKDPVNSTGHTDMEGYGATFFRDNSGVSWCGAVREALGSEVPEPIARKIHPRLFERMEADKEHAPE
jgi:hypothetical protein